MAFSEGVPSYVQHLCHETWYITKESANIETAQKALQEKILPNLSAGFQTIWDRIKSSEQRKLLIGIANEKGASIYSKDFIEKYRLKSPGHVRKAITALEGAGLIEDNRILDLFFREWIKLSFSI
ncbi:MAG: hypothetical protein HY929_01565 [Euryarchaeota archaeon]|nr:hypothetical protein [Euryarchaeota archaeon]